MIHDEPARGSVPPPWFWSLSGFDRMRAFSDGLLPWPPLSRLTGMRMSHVDAGSTTWTMPASEWLVGFGGPARPDPADRDRADGRLADNGSPRLHRDPGHLLRQPLPRAASRPWQHHRARPGRQLEQPLRVHRGAGSGSRRAASRTGLEPGGCRLAVSPPPPPPPGSLQRAEEPVYATPDPYLRPTTVPADIQRALSGGAGGLEVIRDALEGQARSPLADLLGLHDGFIEDETVGLSMPASEWLCCFTREVSPAALAGLANMTGWMGSLTLHPPGHWMAGLDLVVRFHGRALPDGRNLRGSSSGVLPGVG